MVKSSQIIRCDRRYLKILFYFQLTLLFLLNIYAFVNDAYHLTILSVPFFPIILYNWAIRRLWKYTIESDYIRTEKLFTKEIEVQSPIHSIKQINVYEGVLEALFDVGTVEISIETNIVIKWRYIQKPRMVEERIKSLLSDK